MIGSFTDLLSRKRADDDPVALSRSGQVILWRDFRRDVGSLVSRLSVMREIRWALCFEDSYWFAVSLYALAVAGKDIVVPGNINSKKALVLLLDHYDAILSDLPLAVDCPLLTPETGTTLVPIPERSLLATSVTLFTSGSTSNATAIKKTFKELDAEIAVLSALFREFFVGREVLATVSHQHIYGLLFRVLLPLALGVPFSAKRLEYPDQVSRHSSEKRVLISSPALLKRLTAETVDHGYRKVFSSGGPLSCQAAQECRALFGELPLEIYGSSETGGIGWREQRSEDEPWQSFPEIELCCLNEDRLAIKSSFLASEDWYATDDRVSLLPDGRFHLKGRADRVVKISEKRISLLEIEHCLQRLVEVREAVVVPLPSSARLELGAVILLTDEGLIHLKQRGKQNFIQRLRQTLVEYIEPVGVPRRFRFVDEMPVNSQGKYEVSSLEELFV